MRTKIISYGTVATLALLGALTSIAPTAAADSCPIDDWVCDPDPRVDATPVCVASCTTQTYWLPSAPGDQVMVPKSWLVICVQNIGGPQIPVVTVSETPSCSKGEQAGPAVPLAPQDVGVADIEGDRSIRVTTGTCQWTFEANAYGWGMQPWHPTTECAIVAPA